MSSFVRTHGPFLAFAVVMLPLYAWRMLYGVDVSDEGYYAVLPVSWLRSTPAETGDLSPHQFSAVLYYPLVWLYSLARPDLTGLILFLRWGYLAGSFATCVAGYRFFAKVVSPTVATAAAGSLFAFIPLGLPAVSYNTLALFGLASGLFTLARAILDREATGTRQWWAVGMATLLLAAGGCAYPSVAVLAPLSLAALFVLFPTQRRLVLVTFFGWGVCTVAVLGIITAKLGGVGRMAEVIDFTRKLYSGSVGEKVAGAGESLFGLGRLWIPCSLTALLGVLRRLRPMPVTRLLHLTGCIGVGVWWLATDRIPALFTKSHDLVTMLCVGFLPLLTVPRKSLPVADRLVAVYFLIGLVGGLLVASSAVTGLVNFPVLGIVAVACGLALAGRGEKPSPMEPLAAFGLVGSLVWASLTYMYAEVPLWKPTEAPAAMPLTVEHGPYAGLRTAQWRMDILNSVGSQLRPYEGRCRTADFWTSSSGLFLLTPFELRTPMPYWMEDAKTTNLHEKLKAHYADERNRPDLVVLWTMTQEQDTKVDREQLAVLAGHYAEQPAEPPIRIFLRKDVK